MAETAADAAGSEVRTRSRALHRFALLTAVSTLALIVAGGLVTSTESGLSVPDWPLSYGQLMPPMVGGVFYEHGHRMVATAVGVLTLILAIWLARSESRRWVRRLGVIAVVGVIAQGILGGLTVLFLLPTAVSVAHACLAQAFFCLVVAIAVVTSPRWVPQARPLDGVSLLSALTAGAVFLQLAIGAVMRHTKAGLAIPDFPLSLGRMVPPLESFPVAIAFAHRLWALVVTGVVFATATAAARTGRPALKRAGVFLGSLVLVQIVLGATTVLSGKAVAITTAHVATGALLLGTALALCLGAASRTRASKAPASTISDRRSGSERRGPVLAWK